MPFGTGPFGLGTPATLTAPPDGASGCRYLNPVTRDYEQDSTTGHLAQMPPVRQRVLLALLTLRTSSTAVPAFGVKLPSKIGTTFDAEVRAAIYLALRHLTETEKAIRVERIDVEKAYGRARMTVVWTDLTTGAEDQVSI